jgi:hypothetical protein
MPTGARSGDLERHASVAAMPPELQRELEAVARLSDEWLIPVLRRQRERTASEPPLFEGERPEVAAPIGLARQLL